MNYFNYALATFLGLEHGSSCIVVYAGSDGSRISSKISEFVLMNEGLTVLERHEGE